VSVMVPNVSKYRSLMMYIERLIELVLRWVKDFKLVTLHDSIECTRDLVGAANKNRFTPRSPIITRGRDTKHMDNRKGEDGGSHKKRVKMEETMLHLQRTMTSRS
jgi:hypothetical protein